MHRATASERRPPYVTAAVAEALETLLAGGWEMPDPRYLQVQPGSPYGSFLLYKAPDEVFTVLIDVFQPGQRTGVHNHRTWAVVGLLEGHEIERRHQVPTLLDAPPVQVSEAHTAPGQVVTLQETEFHSLETGPEATSRSLHVYGADVGRITRLRYDEELEQYTEFRQGFSNELEGLPCYFETAQVAPAEKPDGVQL